MEDGPYEKGELITYKLSNGTCLMRVVQDGPRDAPNHVKFTVVRDPYENMWSFGSMIHHECVRKIDVLELCRIRDRLDSIIRDEVHRRS